MITDAIRDEKVLKFKVDYNDVRPQFKALETETDEKNSVPRKISRLFFTRCASRNHTVHTEQLPPENTSHFPGAKGFNAMLAVSSVEAAKAYYSTFKVLQEEAAKNQAAINAFGLQPSSPLLQMKSKAPLVILLTKALIPAR